MFFNKFKDKENILKQLYDISFLDEPINLETIKGIPQNRKLQIIYFNLLWGVELKLPEIDGAKSLFILIEYFFKKFKEINKISLYLLSRKIDVFYLFIERLLKLSVEENEEIIYNNIEQYLYDKDFFNCFLITINKLSSNSSFIEKFSFFSKVSTLLLLILIIIEYSKYIKK